MLRLFFLRLFLGLLRLRLLLLRLLLWLILGGLAWLDLKQVLAHLDIVLWLSKDLGNYTRLWRVDTHVNLVRLNSGDLVTLINIVAHLFVPSTERTL